MLRRLKLILLLGVFSDLTGSDFLIGAIHTIINPDIDLQKVYVPQWSVTNGSCLDDGHVYREMVDEVARQMSLSAETGSHKARLLLREAEDAEAICHRAEASNFETMEKSLRDEMNALRGRNVILEQDRNALDVKVTELETSAMSKERELTDLNALVTSVKSQNDSLADREKFYPHLLTTITGRRWLLTHGMELAVANYLNSPEYLFAIGAAIGKAIEKAPKREFLFTRKIEVHPVSVETVMDILRLEGPFAEKLGLNELKPNVDQLMVPIHHSRDQAVVGATSRSLALDVSSARVQKISENIANQRSALRDVFFPLAEPFSAAVLTGTEGTSNTMAVTADTAMVLSTTFASASTIAPISVDDYEVMGADDQAVADENAASFPSVVDAELNIPR
nr:hypothetical protein [Tanacetum cinerariifolium]